MCFDETNHLSLLAKILYASREVKYSSGLRYLWVSFTIPAAVVWLCTCLSSAVWPGRDQEGMDVCVGVCVCVRAPGQGPWSALEEAHRSQGHSEGPHKHSQKWTSLCATLHTRVQVFAVLILKLFHILSCFFNVNAFSIWGWGFGGALQY